MSEQMINHVNSQEKANKEPNNESVTAELERYKERVKTFEQRLNIDLSNREKMIDSQMDDMIKEKLALKEQVDSLEKNLSKQIKEKECLLQTFSVFKNESKEKENKYIENEIDLEKKIKELDNIIFKRIKPTLYDGIVISTKHVAMPVIDDEETLILEEVSRSKMSEKEKDPEAIKQNISYKPIDYEKLDRLSDDFGKCFTPQQELSAEQAFWLRMSNPTSKSSEASPVKIEAPIELPKVSLVNESLKKLKFHLARFDNVVKIRTTPDARTEVQTVFDQIDADVQQSSVDKQCLEIAKKELLLENDRLLQQIIKRNESCDKCFNLDVELLKSQNAHNDLLKSYSQLEKYCISLELSIQLNQEIFQKDESCSNQNALEIPNFFENNDLKAQLQDKDTTICKLKEIIKSMREKSKEENVNYDYCEIETKNVELENSVAKLLSKNEHLCKEINHVKQVFKDQFDTIKRRRVRTTEQNVSLIDKLNLKCAENENLKAQIQDKVSSYKPAKHKTKNISIMRACVIDFGGSYQLSIRCAPFEALYGRKCRSPVLWVEIRESSLIGPELVQETTDKVVLIKEKLKAARDRQKSYVDFRRKPLEFEVRDRVLLKVTPWKGVVRFGKKGKLAPRYVGPFEILERIGPVAYRLRLPEELSGVHDTFHVSNLKKC
ncbi:hypothetical protein Tco_0542756 [Tanacetum coccineum]